MTNGLVAPSAHLHEALASLHRASAQFASADPGARAEGEAIFLSLRQSRAAVEYACFALEHSTDAYVLFQALTSIVAALPNLELVRPSPSLPDLATLFDFLAAFHLAPRNLPSSSSSSSSSSQGLPRYVGARCCQALAAVERRTLQLELEAAVRKARGRRDGSTSSSSNGDADAVEAVLARHRAKLASLLTFDQGHGHEQGHGQEQRAATTARIGIAKALVDELRQGQARPTMEARWVRAFWQLEVQPGLLQQVLASLVAALHHAPALDWLLVELAPLLERLLAWPFIVEAPYAGLQPGDDLSLDDVRRLLAAEEDTGEGEGEHENEDEGHGSSGALSAAALTAAPRQVDDATLLSTDLVSLLGAVYAHARAMHAPATLHQLRACLVQAARFRSCTHAAGHHDEQVAARMAALVDVFDGLVAAALPAIDGRRGLRSDRLVDASFCAQFVAALAPQLDAVPLGRLEAMLSTLARVTAAAYRLVFGLADGSGANDADDDDDDERQASDTLEAVLAAWFAIVDVLSHGGTADLPPAIRSALWTGVVQPYIDGRLAQQEPDTTTGGPDGDDDEEQGEEQQPDWLLHGQELLLVASLARLGDIDACLAHLAALLDGVRHPLEHFYQQQQQQQQQHAVASREQLEAAWDKLHWLALIAGHVVADESRGEVASTPRAIASLAATHSLWHIVDTLGLALLDVVLPPPHQQQADAYSPQVAATLLWFGARIVPSYLLVSHTPLDAHLDGPGGVAALSRLVGRVEASLVAWRADADVLSQAAAVLASLTRSTGAMQNLLSRPEFDRLVATVVAGLSTASFVAASNGALLAAVVGCIYAARDSNVSHPPQAAFDRIAAAVDARLSAVMHDPAFTSHAQRPDVVAALVDGLDMLEGLAMSAAHPRSARVVFDFVARFLGSFAGLARLYRRRTDVVAPLLRVTATLATHVIDQLGDDDEAAVGARFHTTLLGILDAIDAETLGLAHAKKSIERGEDDAAEPYEVLCLILDVVQALLVPPLQPIPSFVDSDTDPAPADAVQRAPDAALATLAVLVPLVEPGFNKSSSSSSSSTPTPSPSPFSAETADALAVPRVVNGFVACLVGLATHFSPRIVELASSSSADATSHAYVDAWLRGLALVVANTHDTPRLTDLVGAIAALAAHIAAVQERMQQPHRLVLHHGIRQTFRGKGQLADVVEALLAVVLRLAFVEPALAPSLVEPLLDGLAHLARAVSMLAQGHAGQRSARLEGACARALAQQSPPRPPSLVEAGGQGDGEDRAARAKLVATVGPVLDVLVQGAEGDAQARISVAKALVWDARAQLPFAP
ncbi:hypothetical protein FA10DRAFT_297620 [Acaromyces ingoldii]|uniref:Importin N-terminal domain-containing protein n=1 Tax=Acaromyces ingoldii TaxID=215250 RepID=A0A316YHI0_9BASI|nr:hypothetical protein FA10DRAFT_297620 [Acaromyces ingoldii]PWN87205.1 hypothetical protein FA10DRAFT_297620 [Acaromyces ingoldii]